MPLRQLLRMLMNNEEIIRKLSDSYPIRRAAQLTAYFFHKGKEIGEDNLEKLKESDMVNRLKQEGQHSVDKGKQQFDQSVNKTNSFLIKFFDAFSDEWKKAEKEIEEKRVKEIQEKTKRKGE
ncbi:protein NCBP2AS2 homolog [Aplysia californica]|uniref:Protein NCBP2AS2 homolog n=1 Tax=Aplysia californica TaxID=6500 RepID=A0ABM0JHX7_APLCA|nr:protein NCBP2AS2 homolog [Aplysia californica]XP_005094027.1 protein NCBP2AS2 homolog [Aplysia californica]XP_005094029.1 protein NCBP2AS2 homolog [Aplysia californica]XP_005094030.1 protein NCBP2AS2 homolog [Aplysia californica]